MVANLAQHDLETRLYVPSWWARAYEFVGTQRETQSSQVFQTSLCPAMSDVEMNALSVILSSIQSQLLSSQSQKIELDPREFIKHAPAQFRQKYFSFSRLLQALAGVRFLVPGDGGFKPITLLQHEYWRQTSGDHHVIEIQPSSLGYELILGYGVAVSQFMRQVRHEPTTQLLLMNQPPIVLWRAVWHELTLAEQVFLLRLEKAMQWDVEWLHFDGIFSQDIQQLFHQLEIPKSTRYDKHNEQEREELNQLAFLERFGRKLVQHGMIRGSISDEYLALSKTAPTQLAWQASQQKLRALDAEHFRQQAARFFVRHRLIEDLLEFLKLLGSESPADRQLLEAFIREIHTEDLPEVYAVASPLHQPVLHLTLVLFAEWFLRWGLSSKFAVPDHWRSIELEEIFSGVRPDTIRERYLQFVLYIRSARLDWEDPRLTVLTMDPAKFKEVAKASQRSAATPPVAASRPQPTAKVTLDPGENHLRKLAAEELSKMFERAPEQYALLKRNYIESLEHHKRQILNELESRSKPQQFDAQLRPGLIRFMVENPAMWTGATRKGHARMT